MMDTTKIATVASSMLKHKACAVTTDASKTCVTIGPVRFEIDHVDRDSNPRTQADVEALVASLCASKDAQYATDALLKRGDLVKRGTMLATPIELAVLDAQPAKLEAEPATLEAEPAQAEAVKG
jgi:hypothetical protein